MLLRLPLELKELFREWLATEFPDRAARVINILRSMHGGKDYVAAFGIRHRGQGPYAEQIGTRFRLAVKRLGLDQRHLQLRTDLFRRPVPKGGQLVAALVPTTTCFALGWETMSPKRAAL